MKAISVRQVERAYAAVDRFLRLYVVYRKEGSAVRERHKGPERGKTVNPPQSALRSLSRYSRLVEKAWRRAQDLQRPIEWEVFGAKSAPAVHMSIACASWAEWVLSLGPWIRDRLTDWLKYEQLEEDEKRKQFAAFVEGPEEFDLLQAHLKLEAAKVRDRVLGRSKSVRYAYVFAHLSPLSGRLLAHLMDNPGRKVSNQGLAEKVWRYPNKSEGAIQAGVSRLRRELRKLEEFELEAGIKTESGGYSFQKS